MRPFVTNGVAWSVTIVSPAKKAPIEMPFWLWTRVGCRNHVFDRGPDPPWEGAILGKGWPVVFSFSSISDAAFCQITLTTCFIYCVVGDSGGY